MEEPTLDYQKVGEAFVLQYYTQMHKDPSQMYKFYQDSSTFVHGDSEMGKGELIVGKTAIHERILSLNLQQVHTKIRQVDSHASIRNAVGPSVIIQVTGELSVAGETMRPFVQTFVLVQESERNYFVFNDIFRYQLYDEDLETDPDPAQDEGLEERPLNQSPLIPDHDTITSYEQTLPPTSDMELEEKRSPVPPTGTTSGQHSDVIHDTMTNTHWSNDQFGIDPPQTNGLPEDGHMTLGEDPSYPLDTVDDENTTPNDTSITMDEGSGKEDNSLSDNKTWAARIAKNIKGGAPPTALNQPSFYNSSKPQIQPTQQSTAPQQQQQPRITTNNNPLPQREPKPVKKPQQPQQQQQQPVVTDRPQDKKPYIASSAPPLTTRTAPDSHQVFVGGLPANTSESELREVFTQFGKVMEVRVNPKNFGFIVFDNDKSVREVMATKDSNPLMLREKRLNIEEKRQSHSKGGVYTAPYGAGRKTGPLRPMNRPQRR